MPPGLVSGAEHRQDAGSSTSKDGSGASISTPFFKHDNIMDLATGAPGSRVEPRQANGRMCFACVIQDNSPNVIYNGNWILNNEKPRGTTHSTTSQASGVSLTFNGTQVMVFGTVPKGNGQIKGPKARYVLDNVPVLTTTLPVADDFQIRNQPFFAARDLDTSMHTLRIEMVEVDERAPYILQHFFVRPHNLSLADGDDGANVPDDPIEGEDPIETGGGNATVSYSPSMTNGPNSLPGSEGSLGKDPMQIVKILAAVLGAVVLLVLVAMGFFLVRRKMMKSRSSQSGRNKWARFFKFSSPDDGPRPETMFTSSDSIMQNDPNSIMRGSSAYSRSDGRSDFVRASSGLQAMSMRPDSYMIPSSYSRPGRI